MVNRTSVVDRFGLRKLVVLSVVILGLVAPSAASASITSVFGTVTCETQGSGQRWCGNSEGTMVPSWDGTPIDVSVAFPPASGPDNNYPVVGIYHGYGGTKIKPSSSTAQRWLAQGYAVFSITDRGFGESCGTKSPAIKTPACANGYIHLMSRRYEVRDAQYLLGLLADEGVINPQEIGATGASYGGGMSSQLGSLKDRVELPNGELIPWVSPKGTPMKIAATAPELTWTDLAQSLQPNGSNLDYVANAPYAGVLGNHEFGIQKQNWNTNLYFGGLLAGGFYAPSPAEPEANITEWFNFNNTGGPYNGQPLAVQQETQLPNHGAYYTNLSEPPAPVLFEDGWDDDLFPADQGVDYYNKVRAAYPTAAIEFWGLDYGHNPRSANASAADIGRLFAAQNAWFAYYIRGEGSEPAGAHGGVTAIVSHCPATAAGSEYKARNWASLAPGEIRLEGAAEQTIEAPGIAPKTEFVSGHNGVHDGSCRRKRLGGDLQAHGACRRLHDRRLADRDRRILDAGNKRSGHSAAVRRQRSRRHATADRPCHLPTHQPGWRFHEAGVPDPPAGVERRGGARRQARAARAGLHLRPQLLDTAVDQSEEPRTAAADDRTARKRWRPRPVTAA